MPYAAVLMDAHGTLLRPDRMPLRLVAALGRRGIAVTEDRAARALTAEIAHFRARCHLGRDAAALRRLHAECAAVLAGALGLAGDESVGVPAALGEAIAFRAFPDARPLLDGLRRRGIRTAVVSNWDCSLPLVLLAHGIRADAVVTAADVGARKPDAAPFAEALRRLGAAPRAALHVGDRDDTDGAGARAAGIDAVVLDRSAPAAGVGTIRALTDVLELV